MHGPGIRADRKLFSTVYAKNSVFLALIARKLQNSRFALKQLQFRALHSLRKTTNFLRDVPKSPRPALTNTG